MPGRYVRETIENWAADFAASPRAAQHAHGVREFSGAVLVELLCAACDHRDLAPGEVEEEDIRTALLGPVARLELPGSVRDAVPSLVADFLTQLQEDGRLAGGRSLGTFVRALAPAYRSAAGGPTAPVRRPSRQGRLERPVPLRQRSEVQALLPGSAVVSGCRLSAVGCR